MDEAITTNEDGSTVPNSPETSTLCDNKEVEEDMEDVGLIGELYPLNRVAKDAFHRLAARRHEDFYEHHCHFIRVDSIEDSKLVGCFPLSLGNLPEFAPIGWRIGRGRKNLKNAGVDILLLVDDTDEIAGIHARFAWVKGGGGFFLFADNKRGKTVTLNGEVLSYEQRLIPYRNTIGIGECYFSLKFPTRTVEQDEQFQVELATFYSQVLSDSVPLVAPTPCEREVMMGDWVVRNAIAKGSFGHVYAVTHTHTGKSAAAKELWRTPGNSRKVDEEVTMAKYLQGIKHVCKSL